MKTFQIYSIVSGMSYFLWWWGFYFLLPFEKVMNNYPEVILHHFWIPVNLFQVLGLIFYYLFITAFIQRNFQNTFSSELIKVLTAIAVFGLSGIAFYETFLWPDIAFNSPDLLLLKSSPVYNGILFLSSTITVIFSFMISGIYIGNLMRKESGASGIIFSIGIFLFCMGYSAGEFRYAIQSVGLSGWSIALVYYGLIKIPAKRKEFDSLPDTQKEST